MRVAITNSRPNFETKKPRIYFTVEGETIYDQYIGQDKTKESEAARRKVLAYLKKAVTMMCDIMVMDRPEKVRFDKYAGCSMCPCSPGFVVEMGDRRLSGRDWWITITLGKGDEEILLPAEQS